MFLDFILLARDVAFVFYLNFDLFSRLLVLKTRRERRHLHQLFVGHFRTTEQIFTVSFTGQRRRQSSIHFRSAFRQRINPAGFQALTFTFNALKLLVETRPAFVIHQTQFTTLLGQAQIGVVFTQHQAVFRTRGKHAVRFFGTESTQIVHQDAKVGLRAARRPPLFLGGETSGVQACQQALSGGFFITGGAVNLAGKEQAMDKFAFQRRFQVARVKEIVLNSVARANDFCIFHPLH